MLRFWYLHLPVIVIISVVISNSQSHVDNIDKSNKTINNVTFIGTHRVIKRFAPQFSLPRPKLPTLPRPHTFTIPLFHTGYPKGDYDEPIDIEPYNRRRKKAKAKRAKKPPPRETEEEEEEKEVSHAPLKGTNEDRTLLTANALLMKKAVLAKKAIILASLNKAYKAKKKKKIKKWKKKAALAGAAAALYGLKKASKVKGLTVKTPGLHLSVGPPKASAAVVAEEAKIAEEEEDAISFLTAEITEEDETSNSTETGDTTEISTYVNTPEEQATMMQQLQQQLIEQAAAQQQQQQPQTTPPTPPPLPPSPEPQPTPEVYTPSDPVIVPSLPEEIESYKGKKAAKKAKKKAKKKPKPRPVNLGVKANVYKKFNDLAQHAHKGISSFIQIDVDFFKRADMEDFLEPNRFLARTAKVSGEFEERKEELGYAPANFLPPWKERVWEKEYPKRGRHDAHVPYSCGSASGCVLKPIYVLFKKVN